MNRSLAFLSLAVIAMGCAPGTQAPNDYRVAGPFVDLNFGLIEIDWQASPSPRITFSVVDVEGKVQFEHQVHLGELRPKKEGPIR